jgi:hypothetical protein
MSGTVRWESASGVGRGELIELARDGASFVVSQRDAAHLRGRVKLGMELSADVEWHIAANARVEGVLPRDRDTCRVSVAFPESD